MRCKHEETRQAKTTGTSAAQVVYNFLQMFHYNSMLTNADIENFKTFTQKFNSFIVIGHKEPDGDCISSSLGLAELLRQMGKNVEVLSAGPFKRTETKKYQEFFANSLKPNQDYSNFGMFIVDCSDKSRIGEIDAAQLEIPVFVIDHHKTAQNTGNNCIIHPESPAAVYLIQLLFEAICGEVTEEIAPTLFFGLCTDTGFFRFLEEDSAEVFMAVSRLVAKGASPKKTYNHMTGGKAFSTRKLLGVLLNHAQSYFGGRLIITYENQEDTAQFGENGRDSDMLYQALTSIEGVEAVVNIKQETETECTAGLRSIDSVDVSKVAAVFGGGGHKNAAGLSTEIKVQEFIPKLVEEFAKIFEK